MKKLLLLFALLFLFTTKSHSQVLFGNGTDGNPAIGPNTIVNSYKKIQGVSGSTFTLINNTGFTLSSGSVVLLINMYTGEYELRQVNSMTNISVSLGAGSIPNSNFSTNSQMVKVPQYSNLTVGSGNSITCPSWDGASGGVICFLVANTLTLNGGEIDVAGKGFFGGAGGFGGNGGAGGLGGYSGSNNSPIGGLSGFGGSGVGGAGWGGALGYPGSNGNAGSSAYFSNSSTPLPCGNTIASCNNSPNPNSRLFMGDGGAGGNGGNGKYGAGGGGSKCNQTGIDGGSGGNGGNGGNGGQGGGIIFIKAGNVAHTNTQFKAMGSSGTLGFSGTTGGNGGNGTCGGGGGDGADGGNGGGAGHGGAGGAVKIIKSGGNINSNLVNVSGGAGGPGGAGGAGGLGGVNSANTIGICSCGTPNPCSFPLLIPFLSAPTTTVTVDLAGVTHFVYTYGDSILDLMYTDAAFCNGYFMGILSGTLFEAGAPVTDYFAPVASLSNNILASLVDFVNNNPTNLDATGQSILTLGYHLLEACNLCAQCNYQLSENGDPGSDGPNGTIGGNGYFDDECSAPVIDPNINTGYSLCPNQCISVPIMSSDPNSTIQITSTPGFGWIQASMSGNILSVCNYNYMCNMTNVITLTATNQCGTSAPISLIISTPYDYLNVSPSNQTVCSGIPAQFTVNSNSPCGFGNNYSLLLPSGIGCNIPSYGTLISGMNFNPIFSNTTSTPQNVIIEFSSSCGNYFSVQVTVNPIPLFNPTNDLIVCCQTLTNTIAFSGIPSVTVYSWSTSTNSNISGYFTSGTGNIPPMTPINNSSTPQTLTYTVNATNGNCPGLTDVFTVTVLPCANSLVANNISNQSLCSGSVVSAIQISGNATSYSWTNSNLAMGLAPSGVNLIPSFTANNTSQNPITSSITITPAYTHNGFTCNGNPQTYTFTVYPASTAYNITASNCDFYTWNGITYTQSGIYQYQGTSAQGCDSIVNLDLTIFKSFYNTETVVSCGSYTWPVNNQTYTQSGIYNFQTFTSSGCDSTITLNLTIGNNNPGYETIEACNSYTWNGNVYTNSGIYNTILQGANGCDSIATLDLTILNLPNLPAVSISNGVNLFTTAQENYNYQWVTCPDYLPIIGANNYDYTALISGEYAVAVSNECGSDTSICIAIDAADINDMPQYEFSLFPNPTFDCTTLHTSPELVGSTYEIMDNTGRVMFKGTILSAEEIIKLYDVAKGTYYLTIGNKIYFQKIVKY